MLEGSATVVAIVEEVRLLMAASGVNSVPNEAGVKSNSSSKLLCLVRVGTGVDLIELSLS